MDCQDYYEFNWILYVLMNQAANPGCILEDFVRWYSPPDWTDDLDEANGFFEGGDASSMRGQLSRRMQKEGLGFILCSFLNKLLYCKINHH